MEAIVQSLIEYGYIGMFIAAFLSGSVVPFSSELVMVTLIQMGANPLLILVSGTIGNTLGSMTCYWVGLLGNMKWIERLFHVRPDRITRTEQLVRKHGIWMAFFCFLPTFGEAIAIVLGLMRANQVIVLFSMTLGKLLRYVALFYASELFF